MAPAKDQLVFESNKYARYSTSEGNSSTGFSRRSLHRSLTFEQLGGAKMFFAPSARIRKQAAQPPSAIVNTAEDSLPVWYKDASLRKMMFWCGCIFAAQICTGFDATLTANFQSFSIWKTGELSGFTMTTSSSLSYRYEDYQCVPTGPCFYDLFSRDILRKYSWFFHH